MMKYKVVFTNNEGEQYISRQDVLNNSKLSEAELCKLKIYNVLCNNIIEQCFLLKDVEKLENENIKEDKIEEKDKKKVKDKTVLLNYEISQSKSDHILRDFLRFEEDFDEAKNNSDEKLPELTIIISSYGGEVDVANSIISYMEYLKSKGVFIITIACGFAKSSGMLIFMHGNRRIFMDKDYTALMWHQPKLSVRDKKLDDYDDFGSHSLHKWKINEKYLINNTKVTRDILDKHKYEDWYIYYDEALELGIVTE